MDNFSATNVKMTPDGWWKVVFSDSLMLFVSDGPFVEIRDWIKNSLIYEPDTLDDYWRIGNGNSLDFKREEDAMMCYVRYAG